MLASLAAWFAGSALKSWLGSAAETATRIPKGVWEGLTVAAYAAALLFLHQHYADAALKAADASGYARARAEDAKALAALKQRATTAEANAKAISDDTRSKNDATDAGIHGDAAAISVRGPGAAAASCGRVDRPAVPAASSQPVAADHQQPDAAGSQLPAANGQPDLAAVPWQWLVGRAEQCDLDRSEALSWRDWYARESAEWAKLRAPSGGH